MQLAFEACGLDGARLVVKYLAALEVDVMPENRFAGDRLDGKKMHVVVVLMRMRSKSKTVVVAC